MKKFPAHFLFLPMLSALIVLVILGSVRIVNPRSLGRRPLSGRELLDQVVTIVDDRYIGDVDADKSLWYDAIQGLVEGLDPYSRFYPPGEKERFEEETEGKFGGIGVAVWISEEGDLLVNYPILGGPSERAGIRACDRIVAVDGEPIAPILTREDRSGVIDRLRGTPGTEVVLTVVSDGEETRRDVTIVRDAIAHRSVVGVDVLDPEARIGYLHITGFQETTLAEFDEAMRALLDERGIRALVVDLRFNPGGILQSAVDLADRFLRSGLIVSTRGRTTRSIKEYVATPENTLPDDLALVILTNRESASASEVAAGALQDHHRAVLVGEPTYGKGVVQNVLYLDGERSVLKITSAAYFTPSGRCIERRIPVPGADPVAVGIAPDFVVSDPDPQGHALELHLTRARPGEDFDPAVSPCFPSDSDGFDDPQLETALELLRGKAITEPIVHADLPPGGEGLPDADGPGPREESGTPAAERDGEGERER
jgi:carboxyl-terminal processing protease